MRARRDSAFQWNFDARNKIKLAPCKSVEFRLVSKTMSEECKQFQSLQIQMFAAMCRQRHKIQTLVRENECCRSSGEQKIQNVCFIGSFMLKLFIVISILILQSASVCTSRTCRHAARFSFSRVSIRFSVYAIAYARSNTFCLFTFQVANSLHRECVKKREQMRAYATHLN